MNAVCYSLYLFEGSEWRQLSSRFRWKDNHGGPRVYKGDYLSSSSSVHKMLMFVSSTLKNVFDRFICIATNSFIVTFINLAWCIVGVAVGILIIWLLEPQVLCLPSVLTGPACAGGPAGGARVPCERSSLPKGGVVQRRDSH